MSTRWMCLFFICKIAAELTNYGGSFQVDVNMKNIGRIKYRDGEVIIAQNQQKKTNFFFTPFPYLKFDEVECHENDFSDSVELALPVELYTSPLIQTVKDYLSKHHSILCGNMSSSSVCDVSLLPMNSIRLVQKGSRSTNTRHKYTLEESWQSTTLLLQSIEFVIYTSNITICEQLRKILTEKCRLPNFEIHYTLLGGQIVQRQLEVDTEHIANTSMFNQIRAQFPTADSVILTEEYFKKLLSESTDRITMMLRMQEGFESLQDPSTLDKLLEQHLSDKQIKLEMFHKKLWDDLYWNSELTRPDRLAEILNSIIRKENDDSEHFIYDRQVARNATKIDQINRIHLTQHDKQRLAQFNKSVIDQNVFNQSQTDGDTNKQYLISRDDVEKLLRVLFNSVYLECDMIKPRPLHARLIKIGQIGTNTKLFSNLVLVRMRPHIYVLPLRCKPDENGGKLKLSLLERIERLENNFNNLSNHIDIVENQAKQIGIDYKQDMNMTFNDNLYRNINDMIHRKINNLSNVVNLLNDYLNMNIVVINQNINSTSNRIDRLDEYMKTNMAMINDKISAISSQSNIQNNNFYTNVTTVTDEQGKCVYVTMDNSAFTCGVVSESNSNGATQSSPPQQIFVMTFVLSTSNPTFQRPDTEKQGLYYYKTIDFRVATNKTIFIASQSSIDTYGVIYRDSFDSTSPDTNLVVQDDESNASNQFKLQINLVPGLNYTLVVTTFEPDITGTVKIYGSSEIVILVQSAFVYDAPVSTDEGEEESQNEEGQGESNGQTEYQD